jgi:hypothetical protein
MLDLQPDVEFDERGERLRGTGIHVHGPEGVQRVLGVAEPGADIEHVGEGAGVEEALHRAAIGVALDDDLLDFESADGVLDGGRHGAGVAVDGHDVAGIAANEDLAGSGLREHLQRDAGIGAGDE